MLLKDWAEIAQSTSVILASLFAIYGIDAWRREYVGKRRIELAEEVLALFYQAYVLIERYNRHIEVFSRIHALRYRFMAQFGTDSSAPFDELNRVINELILSARRMARHSTLPERSFRSEAALEEHHQELIAVDRVYYGGSEDDPIAPRVTKIVGDIERTCKSIIESRGTLFALINSRVWKKKRE
jgi:hypothetical protein